MAQNEKLHKVKVVTNPISGGVLFIKNTRIPKFLSPPLVAVPSSLVIFGWRSKIKIALPTFFRLVHPFPKRCHMTPLDLIPGGDRFGVKPTFGG